MNDPFNAVRAFEAALAEYTGAKFAVSCTSCTDALLLCCAYLKVKEVEIPAHTYVGVPQAILNAGGTVKFRQDLWEGDYELRPYGIFDAARRFRASMHRPGTFTCLSFHASKILGHSDGGAVLTDSAEAADTLKRMRFDGRREGVHPAEDSFIRGYHCYMAPSTAAALHRKLMHMPRENPDLPRSDYSDLSTAEIFK